MDEIDLRRTQDLYFFGVSSPGANKPSADQYCMPTDRMATLSDLHQECVKRGWYTPLQTKHKSSQPAGEILMLYTTASNDLGCVGHIDGRTAAGRHTIDNFRSIQGLSLGLSQLEREYPGYIFPKKELAGQVLRECTITDNPNFKNDTYIKFYHNDPGYLMDTLAEMTSPNGLEKDPTRLIARLPQELGSLPSIIKNYSRKSQSFHISPKTGSAPVAFKELYQSIASGGKKSLDPFFKKDPNFEKQPSRPLYGPAKHRSHRTNYSENEPVFIGNLDVQPIQEDRDQVAERSTPSHAFFPEEVLDEFLTPSNQSRAPDFWGSLGQTMSNPQHRHSSESSGAADAPSQSDSQTPATPLPSQPQSNANPSAVPSGQPASSPELEEMLSLLERAKDEAKKVDESQTLSATLYETVKQIQKLNPKANLSQLVEGIMQNKVHLNAAPPPKTTEEQKATPSTPSSSNPKETANLPPLLPPGQTAPLPNGVGVKVNPTGNAQQVPNQATNGKEQAPSNSAALPTDPIVEKQAIEKLLSTIPYDRIPLAGAILHHNMNDMQFSSKKDYIDYVNEIQTLKETAAAAQAEIDRIKKQDETRKQNNAAKVAIDKLLTGSLKTAFDSKNPKLMAKAIGKENLERFSSIMRAYTVNDRPIGVDDMSFLAAIATTADARSVGTNQTAQARVQQAYNQLQSKSQELYESFSFAKPIAPNRSNAASDAGSRQSNTSGIPQTPGHKSRSAPAEEPSESHETLQEDGSIFPLMNIDTTAEADPADILTNFNKILKYADFAKGNGAPDMARALGHRISGTILPAEYDKPNLY